MKNAFTPPKTCSGTLEGANGNAFALISHFRRCAKESGWTPDEIQKVRQEAMKGDYDHLVSTLLIHLDN